MRPVGFGVLGARSFVATRAVVPAILASAEATLVAVASRGGPVPDAMRPFDVGSYEAVIAHPGVEAVYVPLPNGLHREWVERAAGAGRHVLCEKPLAPAAPDAEAMFAAAGRAGVLLAEAWMTPFAVRWRRALDMAAGGELGEVRHLRTEFTFTIDPGRAANYRWDPAQGGGALLDLGIYCLGPAAELWGCDPFGLAVGRHLAPSGVDATTSVHLAWEGGASASALVSFELPERQLLEIVGTAGRLAIVDRAHTGGPGATAMELRRPDGSHGTLESPDGDPYGSMVSAFALAVRGVAPWPRPEAEVLALHRLLDRLASAPG
jgi:D-xylose 1-dehydrogenase (NADP+, D-xylono-1,5-lactone-forming)